MTTNIYQTLCDEVGAYYMTEGRECDSEGNICSWYKNYPPQTAEQRERLLKLILSKQQTNKYPFIIKPYDDGIKMTYHNNFGNFKQICEGNKITSYEDTYEDSLYELCFWLTKIGVLDKEEVAKALTNVVSKEALSGIN